MSWLEETLRVVGLDQPETIDYLLPILSDESEEISERLEACSDFLQASVSDDVDLEDLMSQIKQKLLSQVTDIATSDTSKKEESLQKQRDLEEREELERARAELELAKLEEEELKKTGKVLTREEKIDERKKRELVEKYGGKMEVDEDGDFVYVGVEKDKDIGMALNENQERVKSQAASEREAAKKKHQEKVKHEKELLEKDKLKKEKAKRKTQKREKRRM